MIKLGEISILYGYFAEFCILLTQKLSNFATLYIVHLIYRRKRAMIAIH